MSSSASLQGLYRPQLPIGLKVECLLDERTYEKGIKVSDAEMQALDITGDGFHPEWNYTIKPRRPQTT
jgi:hypothetical protein